MRFRDTETQLPQMSFIWNILRYSILTSQELRMHKDISNSLMKN